MKVKALIDFYDIEKDTPRKTNDTFTVSDKRGQYLQSLDFVEVVKAKKTTKKDKE